MSQQTRINLKKLIARRIRGRRAANHQIALPAPVVTVPNNMHVYLLNKIFFFR